ncbi:MoaD/ThiS family protein [Candidatus Woesearchaeota archaeon]|nr:MoaD/ThiS family protein [Candidatus Woesearchaeota archaeon]
MELTVFVERKNLRKKVKFSGKNVNELLRQLKINPEVVIVTRNNQVLTEEEILNSKDKLEILSVVSGG